MRPTTQPGRAIGYLRVSTGEQVTSGLGLEAQRNAIEQTAARLRLPLIAVLSDDGISGTVPLEQRPGLLDAVNLLRRGDVLVAAKRERIARDPLTMLLVERSARERGAHLISAAGEGTDDDNATSQLLRRSSTASPPSSAQ
jgi:DNA invertase Pin-like site-specific DNA recombinase